VWFGQRGTGGSGDHLEDFKSPAQLSLLDPSRGHLVF
jgi:hypothetical protein